MPTAGQLPHRASQLILSEKDQSGAYRRSIVKVTNPSRYGITVGDYFV